MQWQYTMTKQEVRAQFRALTRVQGSIANRQMLRLRLIVPLVVVVAMLVFSLIELGGLPTGEQMGTEIVLLILTALMALLFWGLMPVQYVSMQMSALRRSLPEMTSQPWCERAEKPHPCPGGVHPDDPDRPCRAGTGPAQRSGIFDAAVCLQRRSAFALQPEPV